MFFKLVSILTLLSGLSFSAMSAEICIDFDHGDDHNNGKRLTPLKTLAGALKLAQPGDTIKLLELPHPINISLKLVDLKGQPGQPLIIDGSFNVLQGSRRIQSKDVSQVSPGLFLLRGNTPWSDATKMRFYMLFNGKMTRMGQHSKYKCAPYKAIATLQDYEWTLVDGKDLYFRLPPGRTPETTNVEYPVLDSGVAVAGTSCHLIIKNLIVKNFLNDGYNIHGDSKNIHFENVAAVFNGDDSLSAHETCIVSVKNLVGIRNGTGVCHIDNAEVIHENVYFEGADSRDIFVLNKNSIFKNVYVKANGVGDSAVGDRKHNSSAEFTNCYLYSDLANRLFSFKSAQNLRCDNTFFYNYKFDTDIKASEPIDAQTLLMTIEKHRQDLFAIFGKRLEHICNQTDIDAINHKFE